jgi:hypothetical protein
MSFPSVLPLMGIPDSAVNFLSKGQRNSVKKNTAEKGSYLCSFKQWPFKRTGCLICTLRYVSHQKYDITEIQNNGNVERKMEKSGALRFLYKIPVGLR